MRRALLVLACALAAAAPAAATLPVHASGSSVGEGLPLKAYASITPTVHLFGDLLTAKLAIVADTKWVDAKRLRVRASFTPYEAARAPQVLRLASGRFEQITYTWSLRCIASQCVPRTPPSDRFHVFHFTPARVDYLTAAGRRAYGIDAYWPPVEVLSQVSPGVAAFLSRTHHVNWRVGLAPVASPTYRISPTLLFWLALAASALFAAAGLLLAGRWALGLRPERVLEAAPEATQLERVADELGVERADELALVARELAWSARTPEHEEVEDVATQARPRESDS